MAHDVLAAKLSVTVAEVREALGPQYGSQVAKVELLSGGLLNSNFIVSGEGFRALLRVYPENRNVDEIHFEMETLKALVGSECRVPEVLNGGQIGLVKGRPFILLEFLDGKTLSDDDLSLGLAGEAGEMLGHFHAALRGFVPTHHKGRHDISYIVDLLIETQESVGGEGAEVLAEYAERVWQATGDADEWGEPDGVVHADYYVENLIRLNGGTLALIDFDDSYYGSTFFDVAIGAMEFSARDDQSLDKARLDAFINRYKAVDSHLLHPFERLKDAMMVNCLRFLCYTAPLTLDEGDDLRQNPYVQRIDVLLSVDSKL